MNLDQVDLVDVCKKKKDVQKTVKLTITPEVFTHLNSYDVTNMSSYV